MAYEGLQYPTSPTTPAVYSWAVNFVTQLRVIMNDLNTAVPDLTALTADLTDLQDRVTVLEASGGGSSLTAQQVAELDLVTAVDSKIGSVAELNKRIKTQLEYNADATIHAAIEAHRATTGVRTQVSVSEGLATRIDSVTASLGVTNANVTSLSTAMTTGDAALAASISTVSTQVAGNTASISTLNTSVSGINASSTISVSIGGRVVGTQTISGTPLASFFDVDVDYFRVGNASYSNKPVFQVGTKNGVADIVFHGNLIGDGTITANALAANSVTAAKIAAGTITADKMNVTNLSAISGSFGTATFTGVITGGATGKMVIDVTAGKIYRPDGKMVIDFENLTQDIIF